MAKKQRDHTDAALTTVMNIAAVALSIVNPAQGGVMSAGLIVKKLLDSKRQKVAAEAFAAGIADAFRVRDGRLDGLEQRVQGLDAEEAWVRGARSALLTARLDKARRMGEILGSALASDSPNWQEAAEFIADVEEFGDNDMTALKLLWINQREAFRVMENGQRAMSTDANDYTAKWKAVKYAASERGFGNEEWLSRCGRLIGFGLVLHVQPNMAHQGPADMCFRLTTRAVRFLNSIGYPATFGSYPRTIYKPGGISKTVNDYDEHVSAGPGWSETPQP